MRIDEFAQPVDNSLPFNIVDDVAVFMRNDPMFYRKNFFPAVDKMKSACNAGKKIDANKILGPVVDKACEGYCQKYDVSRTPDELFTLDDRQELIKKLYSEEMENIKQGAY